MAENDDILQTTETSVQVEEDDVKVVMSQQAKDTHGAVSNLSTEKLAEEDRQFSEIMRQYNTQVETARLPFEECNVGNLHGASFERGVSFVQPRQDIPEEVKANSHRMIQRDRVERGVEDKVDPNALAVYSPKENKIFMGEPDVSRGMDGGDLKASDYLSGGVYAQNFTLLHENTHKMHDEKVGLKNMSDNAVTRMKKNRLTETTACATEYLAAANMYLDYKEKGVEILTDKRIDENGVETTVEVPVERILDYYPGLKEVVTKEGFDLNNSEDRRAVVAASAKYWNKERKVAYDQQALGSSVAVPSVQQQLDGEGTDLPVLPYNEASEAMLQDIYIGGNHSLMDLTDCRDLLDTMTDERVQEILAENSTLVEDSSKVKPMSQETVQALDAYLTDLGLEDTEDKARFLSDCYEDIIQRKELSEEVQKVKDILLANGGTITYTDGLIETSYADTNLRTIQNGVDGKPYVINADVNFAREDSTKGQELAQEVVAAEPSQKDNMDNTNVVTQMMLNAWGGR